MRISPDLPLKTDLVLPAGSSPDTLAVFSAASHSRCDTALFRRASGWEADPR